MRQVLIAILAYCVLNLFIPKLWEAFMSSAPQLVVNIVVFIAALVCLGFVAFADPVYRRLANPTENPIASTFLAASLAAAFVGAAWWLFLIPTKPVPKNEADTKQVDLIGQVKKIADAQVPDGSALIVLLAITNSGIPTIADGFSATVKFRGETFEVHPEYLTEIHQFNMPGETTARKIEESEMIYEKAATPIPQGGRVTGWLIYRLVGLNASLLKEGIELTIHFSDARRNAYEAFVSSTQELPPQDHQQYFPGVKDPFLNFPKPSETPPPTQEKT